MFYLRHRFRREPSSNQSQNPSPGNGESVTLIPTAKLNSLKRERKKRKNGLIFTLGGLFGLITAAFLANRHDVINLEGIVDLNLESFIDVIPSGIVKEAKEITVWPL